MSNLQIKICGITNAQDANLAASLGATSLGLIFANSPRKVHLNQAAQILQGLKHKLEIIGVIANETLSTALEICDELSLSGLQLHGHENAAYTQRLKNKRPHLKIIKALSLQPGQDFAAAVAADQILLDSKKGSRHPLDLSTAQDLCQGPLAKSQVLLAGGLCSANVRSYVQVIKPTGVDICSGVEKSPGIKDARSMQLLFQTLRSTTC